MKKRFLALALVASMCVSLAACGNSGSKGTTGATESSSAAASETTASGQTEAEGDPVKGGTLTISLSASPSKLDPIHYSGGYESQIIKNVCDTLMEYNKDLSEYVPSLATDWTVSDDGMTYVFNIRQGVKFQKGKYQDGREMTAEDVAYSLNRSGELSDSYRLNDQCCDLVPVLFKQFSDTVQIIISGNQRCICESLRHTGAVWYILCQKP